VTPVGAAARARDWIATGFGAGYAPVAPGTFGSLWGIVLVWGLHRAGGHGAVFAGFVAVTLLGFWSAADAERRFGRPDPGCVVVDEVAGQMLSLLVLAPTTATLVTGFLLFRLLDIVKPFPARRMESLTGSSGIMADDLLVGIYVNLVLRGLHWGFPSFWSAS
jgi:phosphatidylglycerophosphatase A